MYKSIKRKVANLCQGLDNMFIYISDVYRFPGGDLHAPPYNTAVPQGGDACLVCR